MKATARITWLILMTLLATGSASAQDGEREAEPLAYEIHGAGEPILFIHGSFMEDALLPIMDEAALQGYQRIQYDRAGYGESPPRDEPFSFERGVADALGLIRQLDLEGAHVVGYSLGGVIAVQLARSNPDVVKSLVLLEPPLPLVGLAEGPPPQFLLDGVELWQAGEHEAATDVFFQAVSSPTWSSDIQRGLPEGPEQIARNAHLFFEGELPAFQGYLIDEADVENLDMPILYVVSDRQTPYAQAARDRMDLIHAWLPQTATLVVPETDHALPLQQPELIADAIAEFIERQAE